MTTYRAYEACKVGFKIRKRNLKNRSFLSPVEKWFGVKSFDEELIDKKFDITSLEEVYSKYSRLSLNPNLFQTYWDTLYNLRRSKFNSIFHRMKSNVEVCRQIYKNNKFKDFIPPSIPGALEVHLQESFEISYFDPFLVNNPLLRAAATKSKRLNDVFPRGIYPLLRETRTIRVPKNYFQAQGLLKKDDYANNFELSYFTTAVFKLEPQLEYWLNNSCNDYNSTIIASMIYYGSKIIPVWIEPRDLKDLKESFYGRTITNEDLLMLNKLECSSPESIYLAIKLRLDETDPDVKEKLKEIHENLYRIYPQSFKDPAGPGNDDTSDSESSSQDDLEAIQEFIRQSLLKIRPEEAPKLKEVHLNVMEELFNAIEFDSDESLSTEEIIQPKTPEEKSEPADVDESSDTDSDESGDEAGEDHTDSEESSSRRSEEEFPL